jgi:hypothetical protein
MIIVDAFCGSGSVLLEGLQLGLPVVGSDISEKAVRDSKINVEWLINQYPTLSNQHSVFQADATKFNFSKVQIADNCELITYKSLVFVSEPYLGKPKKFKSTLNSTIEEYKPIQKLYIDFLKNITSLCHPRAGNAMTRGSKIEDLSVDSRLRGNDNDGCGNVILCLIFPSVETSDSGRFSLFAKCVDEIKNLGYTQVRNSFLYGRDYQVVKREIVLLQMKQK